MKQIFITTQAEYNKLPDRFDEYTEVIIRDTKEWVVVRKTWGNATVRAWGNATVRASGNATVEAWGNATVRAWGNATVEASGQTCIWAFSDQCTVFLFFFSVCFKIAKAKITKKSKTATIIEPKRKAGTGGWCEAEAVENKKELILYKRVSKDFKTQEGKERETLWAIGSMVEHKSWKPKESECGDGKFHACSHPYFCDEFRSEAGDKYIAIKVAKSDVYAWPNPGYPHKIAFKKCIVLYECDAEGKEII